MMNDLLCLILEDNSWDVDFRGFRRHRAMALQSRDHGFHITGSHNQITP